MRYVLLSIILWTSGICAAQITHPNAHAHNDYAHSRPLLDALQNGFGSVEADIHLVDGELYVSHNKPKPSMARTLQALYLDPLDSLSQLEVNKHPRQPILLLVDIKTDATRTLETLAGVLRQYPNLFPSDSPVTFVRVVISGNRDYELIANSNGISIDGRPGDLGKGYSAEKMPLISDHFGNWMHWNGMGTPDAAELQKLRDLAKRVHTENKRLRLWAIPDREEAWKVLIEAGVDLINTDRLEALSLYLKQD